MGSHFVKKINIQLYNLVYFFFLGRRYLQKCFECLEKTIGPVLNRGLLCITVSFFSGTISFHPWLGFCAARLMEIICTHKKAFLTVPLVEPQVK